MVSLQPKIFIVSKMIGSKIITWTTTDNNVANRMDEGTFSHMFEGHRKIKQRTQLFNRELRQILSCLSSYKKYVKIKTAVLRAFSENKETDDTAHLSDDDFTNGHNKYVESIHSKCNIPRINQSSKSRKLPRVKNSEKMKNSNSMADGYISDGQAQYNETYKAIRLRPCKTRDDVKRNLNVKLDISPVNTEIDECSMTIHQAYSVDETTDKGDMFRSSIDDSPSYFPGDSGIDETSQDILLSDNEIKYHNATIQRPNDEASPLKEKQQLKIMSTEIVTSKYTIIRDNEKTESTSTNLIDVGMNREQKIVEDLIKLSIETSDDIYTTIDKQIPVINRSPLTKSIVHESDIRPGHSDEEPSDEESNQDGDDRSSNGENKQSLEKEDDDSNISSTNTEIGVRKSQSSLTVASESESLQYILGNLKARNHYRNEFSHEYHQEGKARESLSKDPCIQSIRTRLPPRPIQLDDLIKAEELVELDIGSTFTFENISEDDEIIMMDIPKSIIDYRELEGQQIQLKKNSIIIGDTAYELKRRNDSSLSCIMRMKKGDSQYGKGIIRPRSSIIIRQALARKIREPPQSKPPIASKEIQHAPFPENVMYRNPFLFNEMRKEASSNRETVLHKRKYDSTDNDLVVAKKKRFIDETLSDICTVSYTESDTISNICDINKLLHSDRSQSSSNSDCIKQNNNQRVCKRTVRRMKQGKARKWDIKNFIVHEHVKNIVD